MMVGNKIIKHHIEYMDSKGVMRTPHALPQKVHTLCKGYKPICNFSIYALDDSFFDKWESYVRHQPMVLLLCFVLWWTLSLSHIYIPLLSLISWFVSLYYALLLPLFKWNQIVFVVENCPKFLEIFELFASFYSIKIY